MSNEAKREDFQALTKAVEQLARPWKVAFFASNLCWLALAVVALLR
jgi:hypothetical protein